MNFLFTIMIKNVVFWGYSILVVWSISRFCNKRYDYSNIATTMYLHSFISLTPQFVFEPIAQQPNNVDCQNPTLAIVTNKP